MTDALVLAWAAAMIRGATPLLLALLGETMTQRVGVINLGVEGQMLVGAVGGFATVVVTGNPAMGMVAGMAAGAALSAVHAVLCLGFRVNQLASGVAVWTLGLGLSSLLGRPYVGGKVQGFEPVLGVSPMALVALGLTVMLAVFLARTSRGLQWRAVGDSLANARALGIWPWRAQLEAILVGGALSGLGGAVLAVDYTQTWAQEMTKGRGFVAVGLVIVSRWQPALALPVALVFGLSEIAVLQLQAAGVSISSHLLSCLPYVLCFSTLIIAHAVAKVDRSMPASLANVFKGAN